jgi:hypothetical protein
LLVTNEWIARFTGRSLTAHLVRGAVGIGIFVVGAGLASEEPYLGVLLMLLALVPIGGCPACWVGGLIECACPITTQNLPKSTQSLRDNGTPNVGC